LVGKATTDTLTNKTLTGAVMNGTLGATTPSTVAATSVTASTTLGVTGVATFSAGTALLPAITTTGDTNTGIFFPAADTIAFSEGGAEAARFDSAGNFGLGVTPPTSTDAGNITIKGGSTLNFSTASGNIAANATFNSGWKYIATDAAVKYTQSGAEHQWFNAASGTAGNAISFTQAMTLDPSGNLGVGTTSPSFRLHAVSASAVVSRIGSSGGSGAFINFIDSGASPSVAPSVGAIGNSLVFMGDGSTTERARIDSSGNLLVGTTSTPNGTSVSGTLIQNPNTARSRSANTGTTQVIHWSFYNGNGEVGGIYTNGSATTFYTSSDYRLKENVSRMTGALDKVTALNPVTYKWKVDGTEGQGFIAHELQAVIPDAVKGEKDAVDSDGNPEYQGIDTSFLVATLTAAIQEQQALIVSMREEIEALKIKVGA
jgi:hypothetical protein